MRNTIIATSTLIIGLGAGYSISHFSGGGMSSTAVSDPNEPLYWVAPMDPNYRRDKPGKSPMGMDLVPIYPGDEGGSEDAITIDAAVTNNIGVRTSKAKITDLPRQINTVGFITADENRTSHIHVRSAGWVEKLNRKATGEYVEKDEVIFELYSPDLVNAQTELLQALRLNQASLIRASSDRLLALGMTGEQISALKRSKQVVQNIDVRAPQSGIIMEMNIGEGMYITPSTTVFSLTDLSSIWVKAEVFENQSNWVKTGQSAVMSLPSMPGKPWPGIVDYVYPVVDAKSRTVQVRLSFPNPDGQLKPNMYGEIRLDTEPLQDIVTIPREALIRTGETDRVILALEDGKFRPAEVIAGQESGNLVEIRDGISAGEKIVTSGQFLIDSEASANSSILRMLGTETSSSDSTHYVTGRLNEITEDGYANLTHGPIETLGMPGMTMNFKIADNVDLSSLSPEIEAQFEIKQEADGWMTIMGTDAAAQSHDHASMMAEPDVVEYETSGTINSFGADNMVNITHGPIEGLGMPGMRMDFKLAEGLDVSEFKPTDKIHFKLISGDEGWFIITHISKAMDGDAS